MPDNAYTFYPDLTAEAPVPRRGIHSQTLSDTAGVELVLFAMAAGERLSEHTAARPAIVHVLSGDGELMVNGDEHPLVPGSWLHMAAGTRHAITARTDLVFALYLTAVDTEANKLLARRFVKEVFEDCRPEAVDELVADDFTSHTWGPGGYSKDDLRGTAERMANLISDRYFTVDDVVAEGDRVTVRLTAAGTVVGDFMGVSAAGKSYTIGEIHFLRIAQGKIAEHWHQYDALGMMHQLGAKPRQVDLTKRRRGATRS
jgi:steroid delta-isomerase-like uncharacterized protein